MMTAANDQRPPAAATGPVQPVFVCGHKNPDADSVCAAWAYARLWNRAPRRNGTGGRAVAIRCGHLTRQAEAIFTLAGLEPPPFMKNLHRTLADVMNPSTGAVSADAPLEEVLDTLDHNQRHAAPVVDAAGTYLGLVNLNALTRLLLGVGQGRTELAFNPGNVERTLPFQPVCRGADGTCVLSLMIGAFPFDGFKRRLAEHDASKVLLLTGERPDVLGLAASSGVGVIVVSGVDDVGRLAVHARGYGGWLFASPYDTLETYRRLLLSMPVSAVMGTDARTLPPDASLREAADVFQDHEQRGIPILDDGRLAGIVTRTDLLEPPRRRLILVDHNEIDQAIEGAEDAEIVEIIDHHRLGALSSTIPITVYARPVGSTCTLVAERFAASGVWPDRSEALVLLSGIIADTLALRSPTATDADAAALDSLARTAGLADWRAWANDLYARGGTLSAEDPAAIVAGDCKSYEAGGRRLAIAQVEVTDMDEATELRPRLSEALSRHRVAHGFDWAMLLVTDIVHGNSVLLSDGLGKAAGLLKYTPIAPGVHDLPGVLSRKKQLLPEVLRVAAESAVRPHRDGRV